MLLACKIEGTSYYTQLEGFKSKSMKEIVFFKGL